MSKFVCLVLSFSLVSGLVPPQVFAATATAANASTIPVSEYDLPPYTQTKLPSISSCDAKAEAAGSDSEDIASSGNSYIDAVTSTAKKLNKTYGKKSTDSDDSDDEEDVDGKATLDTDCEKLKIDGASEKLGFDPDKLECGVVNKSDFLTELKARKAQSNKYLACKRGVLDALRGELGCFKKQIADAEGYMNELVNGKGGLAEMLNNGNNELTQVDQEVQDRQSQYDSANERIEGGTGGNPPGLRQAKDAITKLSTSLPALATGAKQQTENLRNTQSRFETLVSQLVMGRTMACLNTPTAGYRCVKDGTTSTAHPEWNGSVSPATYLQCLYAQSANKVSGNSIVKNADREASLASSAAAAFKQAAGKTPSATDLPDFSDTKGFNASMKVYPVKTPADLTKLLSATLGDMTKATGKNMNSQFAASLNTCYATAQKEIAAERVDTNSQIKAAETSMKQSFEKAKTENASKFRELRDNYAQTVKAATGQTVSINTEGCEKASLEDQAKCFDALSAMTDSLATGKVVSASSSLTAPALALTAGKEPIHGFTGSLAAKNMPARSIPVTCAGIDDCLTKYTNLRTQLKQVVDERKAFKETFKTQINNKLLTTAKDLAAKGTTGVGAAGVQASGITLNSLAAGIAARKNQLVTAMSKFGVDAGLDLEAKDAKDPGVDDKTGLYKPSDLKNLVLNEITPALPDTNSKGFTDTLKGVSDRDKELEKSQDKLDTDFSAVEAKIASCAAAAKTKDCDQATKDVDTYCGDATELDKTIQNLNDILGTQTGKDREATLGSIAAKQSRLDETKKVGENFDFSQPLPVGTQMNCGLARGYASRRCPNSVYLGNGKGDSATDGKKKTGSDKAVNGT